MYDFPMSNLTSRSQLPDLADVPSRLRFARKRSGLKQREVAERTGIAESTVAAHERGDRAKVHGLKDEVLRKYARVYEVPLFWLKGQNIALPQGFRSVEIRGILQAGTWTTNFDIDEDRSVIIADDPDLSNHILYAAIVSGQSMNRVYPNGTVVILRRQIDQFSDLISGKRYHIERQRADGSTENTLKTVIRRAGEDFAYLLPESTEPEFQQSIRIQAHDREPFSFVGRVVRAIINE